MRKKPIYLYVLLSLSAVGLLWAGFGRFIATYRPVDYREAGYPADLNEQANIYTQEYFNFSRNAVNIFVFFVLLALFLAALVFVIRKNIQLANITYLVYSLVNLLSHVYTFVSSRALVQSTFTPNYIPSQNVGLLIGIVPPLAYTITALALVSIKLIKQQKEVETEPASSEN